jgi:transcriptional regulator of nitric oxide reductase
MAEYLARQPAVDHATQANFTVAGSGGGPDNRWHLGEPPLRIATVALGIVLLAVGASAQAPSDAELLGQLKKLFPSAATFSPKTGQPAVYKAFGAAAAGEKEGPLLGLAFWTTDIEPLERGFDGPIKMLAGINTRGELTAVIVTDHREPYGYFSVDLPEWPKQFEGKSVRDAFKVGTDVDAITRATISVTSASRAIRNASRKVARAHLAPPSPPAAGTAPAATTAQ